MCSPCLRRRGVTIASLSLFVTLLPFASAQPALRVCADPNNLPFSNQRGEGFENHIAEILARSLNARLEYVWYPQRGQFLRRTLDAGLCDAVMGVPSTMDSETVSQPYYSSTYVLLTRKDRNLRFSSLLDPQLANLRVGIHRAGDGYTPPAIALVKNGHGANLVSYSLFATNGEQSAAANLISAVAKGDVDIAVVWGPMAGYFVAMERTPLVTSAVTPAEFEGVPFTYSISIALNKGNDALRARIDKALTENCSQIHAVLVDYHVPQLVPKGGRSCGPLPQPHASSR